MIVYMAYEYYILLRSEDSTFYSYHYKSHSSKHTYSVFFLPKHTFKHQWIHRVQHFATGTLA